jgi:hypothetical protein
MITFNPMRTILIALLMTLATQAGAVEKSAREKFVAMLEVSDCFALSDLLLEEELDDLELNAEKLREFRIIMKFEVDETLAATETLQALSANFFTENSSLFIGDIEEYRSDMNSMSEDESEYLDLKTEQAFASAERKLKAIGSPQQLADYIYDCGMRLNVLLDPASKISLKKPKLKPTQPKTSLMLPNQLEAGVKKCWVLDIGSDAANVTVTLGFKLGLDGKVQPGSVRLIKSNAARDSSEKIAFQAARRAILRCQRGGYALPQNFDHSTYIELEFNPENMR